MKQVLLILLFAMLPFGFVRAEKVVRGASAVPCVVVRADSANKFDALAAAELAELLGQITGVRIPEYSEKSFRDSTAPAIYVGQSDFAVRKLGTDKFADEEWQIKSVGRDIVIRGGGRVGTLYGVYALLEKLGVRFYAPDETVTPQLRGALPSGMDERGKPFFAGRNIYDAWPGMLQRRGVKKEVRDAYWLYRLRNLLNGGQDNHRGIYTGKMFNLTSNYHNFYKYVPPEKYFRTHPEYFSMDEKGRRFHGNPQGGQLCLSNPEVAAVTIRSLREFIKADRAALPPEEWPVIYDISAMDNTHFICLCPPCKAFSESEKSEAGLVLLFINRVAAAIAAEYPELIIRTFAYSSAELAPAQIRPRDNVLIQYCDLYTLRDCYRPLDSPFNYGQMKKLRDWAKTGAGLMLWPYWNMGNGYFSPPRVETIADAIAPDMRTFAANGVKAVFIEAEQDFSVPQNFSALHYYIGARLLKNPFLDAEREMDEFITAYYGAAAGYVKEFFTALRIGVKKHAKAQRAMCVGRWDFQTPQYMLDSYLLLKKAQASVPEGKYRRRVNEELLPLLWHVLYARDDYRQIFAGADIPLKSIEAECRELTCRYVDRFPGSGTAAAQRRATRQLEYILAELPVPERFRQYPREEVKVFGYPHFEVKKNYGCDMISDASSPTGKALRSAVADAAKHGVNSKIGGIKGTTFGVANLDKRQEKTVHITDIPPDEKYHWYVIRRAELGSRTLFWGHFWYLTVNLSQGFKLLDGIRHGNVHDVWFSARFTGPAYVPGSSSPNAISVERVVLTKPSTEK